MDIVLTGSSGFLGSNLQKYLGRSNQITPMSIRHSADLLPELEGDVVIHLAGKVQDLRRTVKPQEYYDANFKLSKRLYDAFLQSEAKKFIFISSVKAVADTVEVILTEDQIPNPQTHFGKSKLMAEEYIKTQPLPTGKSFYILRPCMIHGPGNKGNLNLLYQFVKKGIPYPLAAFENKRSFLSVENLCFVIKELLEREISSGIYQIADDESLSTNELVVEIAKALELRPRLWKIPAPFIRTIAKIGDKCKLPLTTERLNKLTENYVVSNQKIKDALGKELPISARDGLKKTVHSFK